MSRVFGVSLGVLFVALASVGCGPETDLPEGSMPEVEELSAAILRCSPLEPNQPLCPTPPPPPKNCPPVSSTLIVSPEKIAQGQTARAAWSVRFPSHCTETVFLNGQAVAKSGWIDLKPMADAWVILSTESRPFLGRQRLEVVLPKNVRIKGSTGEWKQLLVQALGSPGSRVVLENHVNMDLTEFTNIYIREGVTLTSESPLQNELPRTQSSALLGAGPPIAEVPLGRDAHQLGPRLFTRAHQRALFVVLCNAPAQDAGATIWGDNVRVRGIRLQGPNWDSAEGDDNLEIGIKVISCVNVEIAHNELSGFSGVAVYVEDPHGRQLHPSEYPTGQRVQPTQVRIHDNFIHHNQHISGNGYGVKVGLGAYVAIERNVFDFNRHAISASGEPFGGYWARHNLVLRGGGEHGTAWNPTTQQFDVHGDAHCWFKDDIYNCGNGGEQHWFLDNAFQFIADASIKLRGEPRIDALIDRNVFATSASRSIIKDLLSNDFEHITIGGGNTYNAQTYGDYGVCDLDGDGHDDLFLATGASWWYSAGGKSHWVFLAPHTERLSQLGLGDFDGDGRCDVLYPGSTPWQVVRGGKGEWATLPGTTAVSADQVRYGDFNGDRITDLFYRAPNNQWWSLSASGARAALASGTASLNDIRLGDFDGDGATDVLAWRDGRWRIALQGRFWKALPEALSGALGADVKVRGNVDGVPGDDLVRARVTRYGTLTLEVSSGASSAWQPLGSMSLGLRYGETAPVSLPWFTGAFDDWTGSDVLVFDLQRWGRIYSHGRSDFLPHGRYAR